MLRPTVAFCVFALGAVRALLSAMYRCLRADLRLSRLARRAPRLADHRNVTVPRSDAARSAFGQRLPDASLRWPDTRFVLVAVAHDHALAGLPTRRIVFPALAALGIRLPDICSFVLRSIARCRFPYIASAPCSRCFVVMIRALTTRSTGPAGTCLDLRSTSARRAG